MVYTSLVVFLLTFLDCGSAEKKGMLSMRVAVVALILALGAVVVLGLSDALNPWVPGGLGGAQIILLLSIPISLALFFSLFLSHRQAERLKTEEREEQERN
jgi:hypothetical protein